MGVLFAQVTGVGKLGRRSRAARRALKTYEIDLVVGGRTSRSGQTDQHLRWGKRKPLRIGDEVTVRILEAPTADVPSQRGERLSDAKLPSERERYEFAKALYLRLRSKFERARRPARPSAKRRKGRVC